MSAQLNPQSIPCVIDSSFNKGAFLTIAYYLIIIKTENIVLQQAKRVRFFRALCWFVWIFGCHFDRTFPHCRERPLCRSYVTDIATKS